MILEAETYPDGGQKDGDRSRPGGPGVVPEDAGGGLKMEHMEPEVPEVHLNNNHEAASCMVEHNQGTEPDLHLGGDQRDRDKPDHLPEKLRLGDEDGGRHQLEVTEATHFHSGSQKRGLRRGPLLVGLYDLEAGKIRCDCVRRKWRFCDQFKSLADGGVTLPCSGLRRPQ